MRFLLGLLLAIFKGWGSWPRWVASLQLTEQGLALHEESGAKEEIQLGEFVDFVKVERVLGIHAITLPVAMEVSEIGKQRRVLLPGGGNPEGLVEQLNQRIAAMLAGHIREMGERFVRLTQREYLRDSNIPELEGLVRPILGQYERSREVWDSWLDKPALNTLRDVLARLPAASGTRRVQKSSEDIRQRYEEATLRERKEFYDKVESNPLTQDQRLAVARNNDHNLVLAAAGTGKTSVVVAKALDLVDRGDAKPSEVLVLAYNRKAAEELQTRVGERAEKASKKKAAGLKIKTFHALGKEILAAADEPHSLSTLAEDPRAFAKWVTEWLLDYIQSSEGALQRFLDTLYQPCDEFRFRSREEYEKYVRDNEYRTLQGEKVRSYGEVLIANWLFLHSVEYEYELQYSPLRRVPKGMNIRSYRPDFRIGPKKRGLYLEHFGIDREGNTRPDIDRAKYHRSMAWKRSLHKKCGTTLVETCHQDVVDRVLNQRLQELMDAHGIATAPLSQEDILETLQKGDFIKNKATLLKGCLEAIRGGHLGAKEIEGRLISRAFNLLDPLQAELAALTWVEVLIKLERDYLAELKKQEAIDFDDMILRATKAIQDGRYKPEWKHIIVDEFQDISASRHGLIAQLLKFGPRPILTAVGDDWQAIYRFSGGELHFTTQFERDAPASVTTLSKTFRYNSSIAEIAGDFIMKNPEQYKKHIEAVEKTNEPQVFLLDDRVKLEGRDRPVRNLEEKVGRVLDKIAEKKPEASVFVLARYNHLQERCRKHCAPRGKGRDIQYLTIHRAKGLEADYCIVVGLSSGRFGFPSYIRDDAVLDALLPPLDPFPHAEERRLFYVALTRARHKCYIIYDANTPSEFVPELPI